MTRDEVVDWLGGYAADVRPAGARAHHASTALAERDGGGFVLDRRRPGRRARPGRPTSRRRHRRLPPADRAAVGRRARPVGRPAALGATTERRPAARRAPCSSSAPASPAPRSPRTCTSRAARCTSPLGDAPRVARFYRGRDCMTWLDDMGLYDTPVAQYPGGAGGAGEDQPLRHRPRRRARHRPARVRRRGHAALRRCSTAAAARDARRSDPTLTAVARHGRRGLQLDLPRHRPLHRARRASTRPPGRRYEPVWAPERDPTDARPGRRRASPSIVWAIGYRPDYRWVEVGVFDGAGRPDAHARRHRGARACTSSGLPWLHTWGSGRFLGIARDAEHVAGRIAGAHGRRPRPPARSRRRSA